MIGLARDDEAYPAALRDLKHPPDPLWVDGDLSVLAVPGIAIVGTRRMTAYGERVAREVAMSCARAGMVVVSGLAQGIDSAAHRGALDAGGRTIAVLGESIPMFVMTVRGRRRPLVPRIRACGALVSEYAAPLSARPWMFARRNATIAALARAVVVVEAGAISGALITAAEAEQLGRALYAVPGPLGSSASVGTNALIASRRAAPLVAVDQLVRTAQHAASPRPREAVPAQAHDPLLQALRDGPLGIDELARRLRLPSAALTTRVATLMLRGELVILADGRVRLA